MRRQSTLLLCSVLLSAATLAQTAPPRYRITPITVPGQSNINIGGLNNEGTVSITASDSNNASHISLWRAGKVRDLGIPPFAGVSSFAVGNINDRNEVIGSSFSATSPPHGFIWRNGQFEDIGHPAGASYSLTLTKINNRDQIIGYASIDSETVESFLWEEGHFHVLPELAGSQTNNGPGGTSTYDINDAGIVVGESGSSPDDLPEPTMWQNGIISRLPLPPNGQSGQANAINRWSHIIGYANAYTDGTPGHPEESLFWHNGVVTVPQVPSDSQQAAPLGINDSDQLVGYASNGYAVLWQDGIPYNLNNFIRNNDPNKPYVTLLFAFGINNPGQILVWGSDSRTGAFGYFLLTPQN
jgi:probable HAF family extracellular repeat protein